MGEADFSLGRSLSEMKHMGIGKVVGSRFVNV